METFEVEFKSFTHGRSLFSLLCFCSTKLTLASPKDTSNTVKDKWLPLQSISLHSFSHTQQYNIIDTLTLLMTLTLNIFFNTLHHHSFYPLQSLPPLNLSFRLFTLAHSLRRLHREPAELLLFPSLWLDQMNPSVRSAQPFLEHHQAPLLAQAACSILLSVEKNVNSN